MLGRKAGEATPDGKPQVQEKPSEPKADLTFGQLTFGQEGENQGFFFVHLKEVVFFKMAHNLPIAVPLQSLPILQACARWIDMQIGF